MPSPSNMHFSRWIPHVNIWECTVYKCQWTVFYSNSFSNSEQTHSSFIPHHSDVQKELLSLRKAPLDTDGSIWTSHSASYLSHHEEKKRIVRCLEQCSVTMGCSNKVPTVQWLISNRFATDFCRLKVPLSAKDPPPGSLMAGFSLCPHMAKVWEHLWEH